jgi:hypothetical protein
MLVACTPSIGSPPMMVSAMFASYGLSNLLSSTVNDYISNFESKILPYVNLKDALDNAELERLGRKDEDAEIEKFIVANTQELSKDKWLCPLSGKKFKGPDFVRKHILNKHNEKVDEVKQEVGCHIRSCSKFELLNFPGCLLQ